MGAACRAWWGMLGGHWEEVGGLPCIFNKGLKLRLELGNIVTGEGERGESGRWRLDG